MNSTTLKQFPHVQITPRKKGVEGMAAIAMKSLLKGNLLTDELLMCSERNYLDRLSPKKLHQVRTSMLAVLSGWAVSPVLELRICAFPNLQHRAKSRITITLCLRVKGENEEEVKEKIFSYYLALFSLLQSHVPEAEFEPVVDEDKFVQQIAEIDRASACSIWFNRWFGKGAVGNSQRSQMWVSNRITGLPPSLRQVRPVIKYRR